MAVSDGDDVTVVKDMGLVPTSSTTARLAALAGHLAIGHIRYSTTGSSTWRNAQPVYRGVGDHQFALGHNGNLTNTEALADEAGMLPGTVDERQRPHGRAASASELAGDPAASSSDADLEAGPASKVLPRLEGAFSLVLMDERARHRRPRPQRASGPSASARLDEGWVLASETPGARHRRRPLRPRARAGRDGGHRRQRRALRSRPFPTSGVDPTLCLFEFVYFARPDTRLYGQSVHQARVRMGEQLAEQAPGRGRHGHGRAGVGRAGGRGLRPAPAASRSARAWSRTATSAARFIAPSQELRAPACA